MSRFGGTGLLTAWEPGQDDHTGSQQAASGAFPDAPPYDGMIDVPSLGFDGVICYPIGGGDIAGHPTWGAANTDEVRIGPANFAPGTTDTPVDGPDPRVISDDIFADDPNASDPGGRSAYDYAFGQFVDHDIDLTNDQTPDGSNTLSFAAPVGDPYFPAGTEISITRGQIDPANGDAIDAVTPTLDLSQVYGSDPVTAASLRNPDGTLQTSAGDNLPIVDGQFMGGDVRAAENPDLTSIDVLFVREHNYWVGKLHAEDPALTGNQLYDMARAITTAEYQNIVYTEFLPSLLGPTAIPAYTGYDPSVQPVIAEEFADGAYRFGHSIVSPVETKIANDGTVLDQQDLIAAAFAPLSNFSANGGADALLRNLAQDTSQQEGVKITSDLLDLLDANPPGDVGDLGAIDVERERDLGIGTFNQTRVALGLQPDSSFSQITDDPQLAAKLQQVYGNVNNLDLFVGGLAETPQGDSQVGPTFAAIIARQFETLRDGDPLFYLNQDFSPALLSQIENTTLSDLILRDTDTTAIQANAFVATERHASDVASPNPTLPQLVIGIDAANAVIAGEPGVANTVVAGAGLHQILSGGGTTDQFVFIGSGHEDTITDFSPEHDTIYVQGAGTLSMRDVLLDSGVGGGTIVRLGGNTIDLLGVSPSQLHGSNFQFGNDEAAGATSASTDDRGYAHACNPLWQGIFDHVFP